MKLDSNDRTEIAICVNGKPLTEYRDHDDGRSSNKVAVGYIEVTSGMNFSVFVRTDNSRLRLHEHAIRYTVSLDGKQVNGRNIKHFDPDGSARGQSSGRAIISDGQEMILKYQFGDLLTDDEPPEAFSKEDFKYLGEIRVAMHVVRPVSRPGVSIRREAVHAARAVEAPILETISEKCLKGRAISHIAKLSDPEMLRKPRGRANGRNPHEERQSVTYPYGKEPFATFIFKYRSRKDLQIEGIIPRDPSPSRSLEAPPRDVAVHMARGVVSYPELPEPTDKGNFNWPKSEPDTITIEGKDLDEVIELTSVPSRSRDNCRQIWHHMEIIDLTGDD